MSKGGMALGKSDGGQSLYVVDAASGDLQVYDAANLTYDTTVELQDKTQEFSGMGAIDVAVDSDHTAYVIHLTAGTTIWSQFNWNPIHGGISLVDLDTNGVEWIELTE